jgi:glycine oxidase
MTHPDVLIIGGGIIGLMAGWRLARDGVSAAVVDSGSPAATDAAAGMLAPSFERTLHGGAALAGFAQASLARWRALAPLLAERSGEFLDFDDSGVLSVAFDDEEAAAFASDCEGGETLTRDETLALEPALAPSVVGGRFSPADAQIDPRRARRALAAALIADGGALLRGRTAVALRTDNGRATGALFADGATIAAPAIILAAGARLAGLAGLPPTAAFPVKGEALALDRIDGAPGRVIRTRGAYLCPKADGRVVVGATEVAGDWSLNPDEARIAALKRGAVRAVPTLAGAAERGRWAGLRPATVDGAPIIGRAPDGPDGLLYALGHYRNGILLAPATADALARLVGGANDPAIAAFSAARFNPLGVS